jgi:hypothetical protein
MATGRSNPPELQASNRSARIYFEVHEFSPDESRHAQPYITIGFRDALLPEIDGTHGSMSLLFKDPATDIKVADRIRQELQTLFSELSLLSFEPGDIAAQRHWMDTQLDEPD